jgi:hypothetical protein
LITATILPAQFEALLAALLLFVIELFGFELTPGSTQPQNRSRLAQTGVCQ